MTVRIMQFLKDFNHELAQRHDELFKDGARRSSDEEFYRDSERYQTLDHLINLEYQDVESFYNQEGELNNDQTSLGLPDGTSEDD